MRNWSWLLAGGLLALASDAQSQARPDFTGRWTMNTQLSYNSAGGRLPFTMYDLTLVHEEPTLIVLQEYYRNRGTSNQIKVEMKIGDKPRPVVYRSFYPGVRRMEGNKCSAWWEGTTLAYAFEGVREGKKTRMVRRMTLAPGGRTLYSTTTTIDEDGKYLGGSPATEVWDKR